MPIRDLHIITFAVPFPADYGGAIDVWNRIKALAPEGIRITLHCFVYGNFRPQHSMLKTVHEVHYYQRQKWPGLMRGQPYIVTSRKNQELLRNLMADRQPIFFEGVHTTGFVNVLKGRTLFLRAHNIEHQYYKELGQSNKGIKSLIYYRESRCLEKYEEDIATSFDAIFTISPGDYQWYRDRQAQSFFLPPFHGIHEVDVPVGRGQYILYQGDLSLEINQVALLDMLGRIPASQAYPVVVAGRSGNTAFENFLSSFPNLRREADVSQEKMTDLIKAAQIILIHSLHASGMKLKIFPALYHGRFVAATHESKTHTPLDQAMYFYDPSELSHILERLWPLTFTDSLLKERKEILAQLPDDAEKARQIIRYL